MSKDKVTEALVQALKQALTTPHEQRLFKSGKLDGLFPSRSSTNADAAALALREEHFEVVRTETRGNSTFDWVTVTPKGVEFLHEHESPAHVLQELHDSLRAGQDALPNWLAEMKENLVQLQHRIEDDAEKWSQKLEMLGKRVGETLRRLEESVPALPDDLVDRYPWSIDALLYLDRREGASEEARHCPLPELFSAVKREAAELSLVDFHDGLRRLQGQRAVLLLPIDGQDGIPQPEYALFDGAQVFYLVTRRVA